MGCPHPGISPTASVCVPALRPRRSASPHDAGCEAIVEQSRGATAEPAGVRRQEWFRHPARLVRARHEGVSSHAAQLLLRLDLRCRRPPGLRWPRRGRSQCPEEEPAEPRHRTTDRTRRGGGRSRREPSLRLDRVGEPGCGRPEVRERRWPTIRRFVGNGRCNGVERSSPPLPTEFFLEILHDPLCCICVDLPVTRNRHLPRSASPDLVLASLSDELPLDARGPSLSGDAAQQVGASHTS